MKERVETEPGIDLAKEDEISRNNNRLLVGTDVIAGKKT